jgi:KUP system potassium uptake protein
LLALGALGIVFGDIGTSPLYALRETFHSHAHELELNEANILGVLSLIFWSLILVITVKYLAFVMRADNQGEGGILALTALATPDDGPRPRRGGRWALILLGLFGTALLYGDGMITPAISVLSAVEGTTLASERMADFVVPLSVVILIALFAMQPRGTGKIGKVFGPVMLVWFIVLGLLGLSHVLKNPAVLAALNPGHGVEFFRENTFAGFLALGSIFLVVTGGEALYADMGHFGKRPIKLGWYSLVLPALLLNYFGQGALLLETPGAIDNPFYRMAPEWALYPLLVLATAATVIASQALISGAFSLTMQAVQLGYCPRVRIKHTSATEIGQIYVPAINWALMVACIGLVLGFRTSTNLAAAYGLAVTATMAITTAIFYFVARERLHMNRWLIAAVCSVFFVVDLAFLGANVFKIPSGGWFPLVIGGLVVTVLTTWFTGRLIVADRIQRGARTLADFVTTVTSEPLTRAPGASVYLFSSPGLAPPALESNYRHNDALHETVIVLSLSTAERPYVESANRIERTDLGNGFYQVTAHHGFLEDPNVLTVLREPALADLVVDLDEVTYFLGREALVVTRRPGMAMWREHLFAFMSRNATPAARSFSLPVDQVLELGVVVEL